MYKRFTSDMYRKHIAREPRRADSDGAGASTSGQPNYQDEEWEVDNPEAVLISIPEGDSEFLESIDYEIVSELDSDVFIEDLLEVQ